jgi:dephospho-CoA kinase
MLKIALTDGIATGKSYVLARLKERGVPVIDADDVVHASLLAGAPAAGAIAAQFGSGVVKPDGGIDRARLAATIFPDESARRQLESILHPIVYRAIGAWYDALDAPMGVASIPLLYETRREQDFDMVVVTVCPPDVQLRRLLRREHMSEEEAHQRLAAQMPAEEKAARGQFVIHTGGAKEDTDRQVDALLAALAGQQTRG